MASVAAITVAAPAMSHFIVYMLSPGLRFNPPESKVMPLPTSARWNVRAARRVAQPDQPGRPGRAAADRHDAAVPALDQAPFSSSTSTADLGVLDQCLGLVGERLRIEQVRRRVDPVAGGQDGPGQHLDPLASRPVSGLAAVQHRDRARPSRGLGSRPLTGGVLVQARAVRPRRPPGRSRARRAERDRDRQRPPPSASPAACRMPGAGGPAQVLRGRCGRTDPDDQDPRAVPAGGRVRVLPAADLAPSVRPISATPVENERGVRGVDAPPVHRSRRSRSGRRRARRCRAAASSRCSAEAGSAWAGRSFRARDRGLSADGRCRPLRLVRRFLAVPAVGSPLSAADRRRAHGLVRSGR